MVTVVKEEMKQYDVQLLELRNDFVFQSFFADERNNRLLLHFVNSILGGTIESLRLMDPTNTKRHSVDKLSIMDLRATTELGEQINIEMQLKHHVAFHERMLYYWANMYSSQMKSADSYEQLKKVIQIIISDFEMLPTEDIHSKFQLMEPTTGTLFSSHIEIYVIQLPKRQEKPLHDMDNLEKWLLFFTGNHKMKREIAMESSVFKEAFEEIRKLSMDPDTVHLALRREIALRDHIQRLKDAENLGMKIGIDKGIEKGKEQATKEFVLKMYDESLPFDLICNLSGLSSEDVQLIINHRANN